MKTKIKRHSRSVISVILAVCMLVSCMTVGLIATDAAKVESESVGAGPDAHFYLIGQLTGDNWSSNQTTTIINTAYGIDGVYYVEVDGVTDAWFALYNGSKRYAPSTSGDAPTVKPTIASGDYDHSNNSWQYRGSASRIRICVDETVGTRDDKEWYPAVWVEDVPTLDTPAVSIDYANVELGGSDGTLSWDAVADAGTYKVFKDGELVTTVSTTSYTIANAAANSGSYTVQAIPADGDTNHIESALSTPVNFAVHSPKFALYGNVSSEYIKDVINSKASHASGAPKGWDKEPHEDVYVDKLVTGQSGKYQITFTTQNYDGDINIGIYEVGARQRGFKLGNTLYNSVGSDIPVPSAGINADQNLKLINGAGSLVFKPNVTYTLTIDQTAASESDDSLGLITITSNAADVNAVARVQHFDPNTGEVSSTITNAPAAVGTAVAEPETGKKNFTTKLTAKITDTTKYDFMGWWKNDEDCAGGALYNSLVNENITVDTDATYYALFREKTPSQIEVTLAVDDAAHGAVKSGISNIDNSVYSGSNPYTIYPGAAFTFEVTATDQWIPSSVTLNGSYTIEKKAGDNNDYVINVDNVKGNTITVNFREATTYNVTITANNATYGTFSGTYVNAAGVTTAVSSTSTETTIAVREGTVVTLTAAANTSGNKGTFTGWTLEPGKYQRKSDTPLSGTSIMFKPNANMTAEAGFAELSTLAPGEGESAYSGTNYSVRVASTKTGTYAAGGSLYTKKVNNDADTEFRSYYEIGETDNPSAGKLKYETDYWFIIAESTATKISNSKFNLEPELTKDPNNDTWAWHCKAEKDGDRYAVYLRFKQAAKSVCIFWGTRTSTNLNGWFDATKGENSKYPITVTATTGSAVVVPDDSANKDGAKPLYVLDGIVTRESDTVKDFGTSKFGETVITSATSGLRMNSYYDLSAADLILKENGCPNHTDEGSLKYFYDADQDLAFHVETTIDAAHTAIGVRAFVMNGVPYEAKKKTVTIAGVERAVYYADITLPANTEANALELIPVYYNTVLATDPKGYIKFYVDANTIGNAWGKNIGYSVWYTDAKSDSPSRGMEGGYPGQPLMKEGTLLVGYIPRYYVAKDAASLPEAASRVYFNGVLLTNLAEHNYTHHAVMSDWGVTANSANYQTFDYEDPYIISNIANIDMIKYVVKYEETNADHQTGTHFVRDYSKNHALNDAESSTWPAGITKPTAADLNGFERLTDIDGNPVDIYGNKIAAGSVTAVDNANTLYVVSVGNQDVTPNEWDTVWMVYQQDGTFIKAANPASFINVRKASQLDSLKGKTVYINYEKFLDGEAKKSNSGDRIDGRWLYSKQTDETTLRARVAKISDGSYEFMEQGLTWADIYEGSNHGRGEDDYTLKLDLNNRTTKVTAKINASGYRVVGMYMLGDRYTDLTGENNGYSVDPDDYDNMNIKGSMASFINANDNRMLIVIEEIPETDLDIYHQIYAGDGAHNIDGFCYFKADMVKLDDDGNETVSEVLTDWTGDRFTKKRFTNDYKKGLGWKIKITLETRMTGDSTFYQWYDNDHKGGYNRIESSAARGHSDPVQTTVYVDVDELYGDKNDNLSINNLDYYSDLQASADINIVHMLHPTTAAGLNADTYVRTTVVDSQGKAIRGVPVETAIGTVTVSSDYITTENANKNYQVKAEIWTVPKGASAFDKFWATTEHSMDEKEYVYDGVVYYKGESVTVDGKTYEKARIMIPISYFFMQSFDSSNNPVTKFDVDKKDFYLYSSLKQTGSFTIEYSYKSRLWSDQKFVVEGDIGEDYAEYFEFTKNNTEMKMVDAKQAEFLAMMAPYENNFKETVEWMLADESTTPPAETWNDGELTIRVSSSTPDEGRHFTNYFKLPYNTFFGKDKDGISQFYASDKDSSGRPYYDSKQTSKPFYSTFKNRYTYDNVANSEKYIYAEPVINKGTDSDPKLEYFQYWNVYDATNTRFIRKCYFNEFNLTFYEAYYITAVYGPNQTTASAQSVDDGVKANISFMENSRNQWNYNHGGDVGTATEKSYWQLYGDRVFSDFSISFAYNNKMIKTITNANVQTKLVIEQLGNLNAKSDGSGELDTKNLDGVMPQDNGKSAVESFISTGNKTGDQRYLTETIDKTKIDNKNCIEFYYNFANVLQEDITLEQYNAKKATFVPEATDLRNHLYRAYAVITDGTTTVASEPAYFTIYDMANIKNYSENTKADGGKS